MNLPKFSDNCFWAIACDGNDTVNLALRELGLPVIHRVAKVRGIYEHAILEVVILGVVGDTDFLQPSG